MQERSGKFDTSNTLLVSTSLSDQAQAQSLARQLVEQRLAACVQCIPGVHSVYRWQGAVCEDKETLLLIKTTRERWPALRRAVLTLHPYELPELIAVQACDGHPDYLQWITQNTCPEACPE